MRLALLRIRALLSLLALVTTADSEVDDDGGWTTDPDDVVTVAVDGPCNIPIEIDGELSYESFIEKYAYKSPVIIRNVNNDLFRERSAKTRILADFADTKVELASANTYSYKKVKSTFGDYVANHLRPQRRDRDAANTLYLFGDIDREEWAPLLTTYRIPDYVLPDHDTALSFGVAGAGTGVPFHIHGPGFAEVIYGAKRWFLTPPDEQPVFDPDTTTLQWYLNDYPTLSDAKRPMECLMNVGEVIYFPDRWWHATLNTRTSVFMSTFLAPTPGRTPRKDKKEL